MDKIQEHLSENWIKWLFTAFAAAFTWITTRVRKWSNVNKALRGGQRALLRDRIIQMYNHYVVTKGYCPIYARESVAEMYKEYKALGGNGVIEDLMRDIEDLPTDKSLARPRGEAI